MKKKLIASFVLAGLVAFGAQGQDFEGNLYIDNAVIIPGGSTALSIQLKNNIDICGFQFDIAFPKGISISALTVSAGRKADGAGDGRPTIGDPVENDNQVVYTCAIAYDGSKPFTGNSGEVATLTINAPADLVEGQYTVQLSRVYVTKAIDTLNPAIPSSSFTLTVETPTYDEGYAVKVLPFALNEEYVDVPILMDNATDIKSFSFDLFIPSSFVSEEMYDGFEFSISGFTTSASSEPSSDGAIHVTAERKRQNKIDAGEGTEIAILQLYYENDIVPTGVYPITINNIALTDTGDESFMAAPYTTEIFVGDDPKIEPTDGVAAFHGIYGGADEFALLTAALPTGATIDLTEVSAMAEDPTTLRTDNVIVTTDNVSYGRAMTNDWGTLCLPFAVETNDNIQLYELTAASSTAMTFNPVDAVEANTPVVFQKTGDGFSVATTNDSFDMEFAAANPTVSVETVDNCVLNGSYIDEDIDVSDTQAYALTNNEFHWITKTLSVKAFRAWLQNNGEPLAASIRIDDSTEGIDIVKQEDGTVTFIFDMQGRQLKDGACSQMYIENGQKKFNK